MAIAKGTLSAALRASGSGPADFRSDVVAGLRNLQGSYAGKKLALVDDRPQVEALWSYPAKAWFPGGPGDPDLRLMRIAIERAEYWDTRSSKMVQLLKMVRAAASGERPHDIGEHREVT